MQENMAKMAGSKGSNKVSNRMAATQNISELPVSVSRLKNFSELSMNVPGDGNVARAVGAVNEGSARKYADVMDQVTGPASEPVRPASDGNNQ